MQPCPAAPRPVAGPHRAAPPVVRVALAALSCAAGWLTPAAAPAAAQDTSPPPAAAAAPQDPAGLADAYRDPHARELVRLARARRAAVDRRITAYEVTARERSTARIRLLGIERLLFRRETVSRIAWTPDTVRIAVLGAREVQPMIRPGARLPPPDLPSTLTTLAFDPVQSEMLLRLDSGAILHPLADGAEAHYRYASGDTTTIRLPDGRAVRLLELRVTARRQEPRLINGAFWLDAGSHAVVRTAFRTLSYGGQSRVVAFTPELGYELDVVIDYALWDLRWWLPRTLVARGVARVAGTRLPVAYERTYGDYRVEGDTATAAPLARAVDEGDDGDDGDAALPCRPRASGSIILALGQLPADSAWDAGWDRAAAAMATGQSTRQPAAARDTAAAGPPCPRPFLVTRAPGLDLVHGPDFPATAYDGDEGPVSAAELRELARLLDAVPTGGFSLAGLARPSLRFLTPELVRYNRVEGLSLGAAAAASLGPAEARAELRAGTAGEVGGRLAVARTTPALRTELAGFRGVEATSPAAQPFALTGTLGVLLLGRDDHDYFRGTGAELRLAPAPSRQQRWELRLFAERQEPLRARSTPSLRGVLDSGFELRPNLVADTLDQAGATLRLRAARGDDPARLRTRAELELHGEAGDVAFARPLLRLGADRLLGGAISVALAGAAGSGFGDLPPQRLWQLGGAATVRGHDGGALRGETFWTARGELGRGTGGLRLTLFADAGWAGDAGDVGSGRPLRGVGTGLSVMDNLLRLDLARGLGAGGGTRVYLRVGGGI
jgi:hypothetical protein